MNTILYLVAVSIVNVIRFLPLKFVVLVGRQMGFLFYYIDAPHRRVAVNNLTNSLGSSRSKKEIIALARENFRRLGEVYLSSISNRYSFVMFDGADDNWEVIKYIVICLHFFLPLLHL